MANTIEVLFESTLNIIDKLVEDSYSGPGGKGQIEAFDYGLMVKTIQDKSM